MILYYNITYYINDKASLRAAIGAEKIRCELLAAELDHLAGLSQDIPAAHVLDSVEELQAQAATLRGRLVDYDGLAPLGEESGSVLAELARWGSEVSGKDTRVSTVTIVFVPSGTSQGPMNSLFLSGGVSPRAPHRDKHQGHFSFGAFLCVMEDTLSRGESAAVLRLLLRAERTLAELGRREACLIAISYNHKSSDICIIM